LFGSEPKEKLRKGEFDDPAPRRVILELSLVTASPALARNDFFRAGCHRKARRKLI